MNGTFYTDYVWDRGALRQRELVSTCEYGGGYLDRWRQFEAASRELSARRAQLLHALAPAAYTILDYGCGLGHFVSAARQIGFDAWGFDIGGVEPEANCWDAVTFFDSLEHLTDPADTIKTLSPRIVFISLPECHKPGDPEWFLSWKHRKPGEHLWHWNRWGLDNFMELLNYQPVMHCWFEDEFRPRYDPALPNILTACYRRVE
jgi:hypothetical protein